MKRLAKTLISIQAVLWDITLSRKSKHTDLKHLTQLQQPFLKMTYSPERVIAVLSSVYSWIGKKEKCLILSIVTASALIHFSKVEACDIVIAVRAQCFAAHAWVEVDGEIISPSEILADYKEIIRIVFDKREQTAVVKKVGPSHNKALGQTPR